MLGGLLPLNETLHHRSLARPKGGTGSKPNPECRGQSPLSGARHLVVCDVIKYFWYSLGVLCVVGNFRSLFLPISNTPKLHQENLTAPPLSKTGLI